jgi:hypothetical protein
MAKASYTKKRFQIEGLEVVLDLNKKLPEKIGEKAAKLFNAFAVEVMAEAKRLCPYDPLKGKHHKKYANSEHLRDTGWIRKAESKTKPTTWMGFSAPHAYLIHEDIHGAAGAQQEATKYSTSGTKAKYLEKPFLEKKGAFEKKIEAMIDEVLNAT